MIESFVMDLQDKLVENCPVDKGNMKTNIYLYDFGTYWRISIEVFYAQYVNYNRQRGPKEIANFHWVEKYIREVATKYGANVELEIY